MLHRKPEWPNSKRTTLGFARYFATSKAWSCPVPSAHLRIDGETAEQPRGSAHWHGGIYRSIRFPWRAGQGRPKNACFWTRSSRCGLPSCARLPGGSTCQMCTVSRQRSVVEGACRHSSDPSEPCGWGAATGGRRGAARVPIRPPELGGRVHSRPGVEHVVTRVMMRPTATWSETAQASSSVSDASPSRTATAGGRGPKKAAQPSYHDRALALLPTFVAGPLVEFQHDAALHGMSLPVAPTLIVREPGVDVDESMYLARRRDPLQVQEAAYGACVDVRPCRGPRAGACSADSHAPPRCRCPASAPRACRRGRRPGSRTSGGQAARYRAPEAAAQEDDHRPHPVGAGHAGEVEAVVVQPVREPRLWTAAPQSRKPHPCPSRRRQP